MQLEVCANSYQSALNAQIAGAHRVELCKQLNIGGITPDMNVVKKVLETISIPVFILIRPRNGDFVYSKKEFERMKQNILLGKNLGCQGIVSGVLNSDNTVDIERTKELIELTRPLPFTFHRAFDSVSRPLMALQQLIDLGVDRVLTSGQEKTAVEGISMLKQLKTAAKDRIIILPGGGVNPENAALFKKNNFSEIHSSARLKSNVLSNKNDHSNSEIIREICAIIS